MTLSPGSKLGPYEILSAIGSGGMGEVWKARDTRLGRTVAIKKVKEQHSERFKQEARSIAALNHPNICQIFDIGDDYLVLEYVEGKPLSSPLPEEEAVKLAIQIATALEEAHQHGIIHRDLKPSNIMVTDKGSVKLLDFGLAKLYEQDQSTSHLPTEDFPATQAGAILGTVAYMSPEQAQGQPADARSDIFSFGLVLYEMLSGGRAFSGESNYAVMDAIVKKEPPPLQASPTLERIVKRCLEKSPSERNQTMAEVKTALEKAVKPKVVVSTEEPQPSIAVLPLVNMSGDKEQEYFSDGLAEDIIDALTQVPGLRVMARTSAFAFRGKEQDVREIGARLNVEHILEGSVRRVGNRIRVTAQLVKASDGYHLWSQRFDREMTDVFAIQDEISQAIVERLRARLTVDRPLVKQRTENMEAYNLFLRGRHSVYRMTAESVTKGKEYLEQAIALDPNYALAYVGIAQFYSVSATFGFMEPKEALAKGKSAVIKALELDDTLADAHALLGNIIAICDFDWAAAKQEYQRAMELNPSSSVVHYYYGYLFLQSMGRLDEAVLQLKHAIELDPLSAHYNTVLGILYYANGQYNLAIAQSKRAMELDPSFHLSHIILARAYTSMGRFDEAITEAQKACDLSTRIPETLGILGMVYGLMGRHSQARATLEELMARRVTSYVPPAAMMKVYVGLEEIDKALEWLEKGIAERDIIIIGGLKSDPINTLLRVHPRYKALLRRMNLEP